MCYILNKVKVQQKEMIEMRIKLNNELIKKINEGSIKACELIDFLLSHGFAYLNSKELINLSFNDNKIKNVFISVINHEVVIIF